MGDGGRGGVGAGDCIMFWGRLVQNCGYHGNQKLPLTYNGENGVSIFCQSFLIRSLPNLLVSKISVNLRGVLISAGLDHSLQCYAPLSNGKKSHRL